MIKTFFKNVFLVLIGFLISNFISIGSFIAVNEKLGITYAVIIYIIMITVSCILNYYLGKQYIGTVVNKTLTVILCLAVMTLFIGALFLLFRPLAYTFVYIGYVFAELSLPLIVVALGYVLFLFPVFSAFAGILRGE